MTAFAQVRCPASCHVARADRLDEPVKTAADSRRRDALSSCREGFRLQREWCVGEFLDPLTEDFKLTLLARNRYLNKGGGHLRM